MRFWWFWVPKVLKFVRQGFSLFFASGLPKGKKWENGQKFILGVKNQKWHHFHHFYHFEQLCAKKSTFGPKRSRPMFHRLAWSHFWSFWAKKWKSGPKCSKWQKSHFWAKNAFWAQKWGKEHFLRFCDFWPLEPSFGLTIVTFRAFWPKRLNFCKSSVALQLWIITESIKIWFCMK